MNISARYDVSKSIQLGASMKVVFILAVLFFSLSSYAEFSVRTSPRSPSFSSTMTSSQDLEKFRQMGFTISKKDWDSGSVTLCTVKVTDPVIPRKFNKVVLEKVDGTYRGVVYDSTGDGSWKKLPIKVMFTDGMIQLEQKVDFNKAQEILDDVQMNIHPGAELYVTPSGFRYDRRALRTAVSEDKKRQFSFALTTTLVDACNFVYSTLDLDVKEKQGPLAEVNTFRAKPQQHLLYHLPMKVRRENFPSISAPSDSKVEGTQE